ncbi:hypothetical protein GRF29_112g1448953 [Pseudopithomyces chartarum]|uniref:CFEM domain-containing protein n=1 Tax=Pseudopithomyces chartarum TaxID=1892770 RepID=A0AAN6LUR7_9PLEO|nr:hypothetical protein GRF29_112g1448953 [Pseudopithomyces chartarum]
MKASIALLISGLAAQQVAAHWDRQASNYNTPGYNNNECTEKQKGGYNWSDLNDGDKPGKYDDFNFGGDWKCSTKKFGKRDHISKRHFGEKAITNKCGKEKPASFSCDQKKEGFSVTHIDVSVDHDADLDFHYKMKDGSICKQRTSCKKEGTTVQNTQCGGAESVDVYLGHSSEGRDDCEIGVHQIGFDCNPGESYTPPPPYTPAPPPSTSEVPVTSSEVPSTSEVPVTSSEVPPPSTPTPPPQTSDSPPPPPEESSTESIKTPICGYGGCGSTGYQNSTAPPETPATSVPVESTPAETPATSAPPAESTPSGECGGYGQPACETSAPVESVPAETPATSAPVESTPAETPATSAPVESTPVESTPAETPATSAPPAESTPSGECGGYGQPACETSAPVESVPAETPATSAPVESTPAETPATSAPVESTPAETPATSAPPAESTPSGECGGYGQPACETKPVESVPETPATSAPAQSTEVSPSSPVESPSAPLESQPPTCLNTWLKLKTECKDNTDSACYCKVPDLTDNVIDCVKAYGTEEEVQQALSYFVGICAPQIPENPQIIDKCSDVPLSPPQPTPTPESPITPPPESPATSASPDAPVTSAPAPEIPADIPCTTISYGGSSYVVPQVGFTTEAPDAPGANPTEPIALYPAAPTPAPAPAEPTAPYPVPSGFTSVPLPTGTGAIGAPPAEFEGAAFSLKGSSKGVGMVAGAVLAFFAL